MVPELVPGIDLEQMQCPVRTSLQVELRDADEPDAIDDVAAKPAEVGLIGDRHRCAASVLRRHGPDLAPRELTGDAAVAGHVDVVALDPILASADVLLSERLDAGVAQVSPDLSEIGRSLSPYRLARNQPPLAGLHVRRRLDDDGVTKGHVAWRRVGTDRHAAWYR